MDALRAATIEEIEAIDGIGPIVAQALRDYLDDDANVAEIQRLDGYGVRMDDEVTARGGLLDGEIIVVTGRIERWSRNEVERLIKELGGRVTGSVSKQTSYLVAGEGGGSKARPRGGAGDRDPERGRVRRTPPRSGAGKPSNDSGLGGPLRGRGCAILGMRRRSAGAGLSPAMEPPRAPSASDYWPRLRRACRKGG